MLKDNPTTAKVLGLIATVVGLSLLLDLDMPESASLKRNLSTPTAVVNATLYATDETHTTSRTNKLIYVHTPKTGGTSMELSALFDDAREHHVIGGHHTIETMTRNAEERGITSSIGAGPVAGDEEGSDKVSDEKKMGWAKTAHIRHPCSRFVSAYSYLTSPLCNEGDARWSKKHIGDLTIDEFILKLESHPELMGKAHLSPLYHWLFYPNGTFGLDMVMCQETWNDSLDALGEMLDSRSSGTSTTIPADLYSSHSLKNAHNSCSDLKEETREAIERVYHKDYCIFGYGSIPTQSCPQGEVSGDEFTRRYEACSKGR